MLLRNTHVIRFPQSRTAESEADKVGLHLMR
jgi:predicted Zn-dependent protease